MSKMTHIFYIVIILQKSFFSSLSKWESRRGEHLAMETRAYRALPWRYCVTAQLYAIFL